MNNDIVINVTLNFPNETWNDALLNQSSDECRNLTTRIKENVSRSMEGFVFQGELLFFDCNELHCTFTILLCATLLSSPLMLLSSPLLCSPLLSSALLCSPLLSSPRLASPRLASPRLTYCTALHSSLLLYGIYMD